MLYSHDSQIQVSPTVRLSNKGNWVKFDPRIKLIQRLAFSQNSSRIGKEENGFPNRWIWIKCDPAILDPNSLKPVQNMYVCMYVNVCMSMYVCMHACMYVCMHGCMHAWMYVCMYACMHVCMYVELYIYIL